MTLPPPMTTPQQRTDADHLRMLAIFHFVFAGFSVIGLVFLLGHYAIMSTVLTHPKFIDGQREGVAELAQFFAIFKWFYLVMGVFIIACGTGNLLSGLFIRKRTHRIFSLVVSAINCMQIPFGTALGVFTFMVLGRGSVRELYETGQSIATVTGR